MTTAIATAVSSLEPFQTEWKILCKHRHSVLLEGPVPTTNALLLLLHPHIRKPTVWNDPLEPLELPSGETGALIIRGVAGLSADDQVRLLAWLGGSGSRTQIVSTTERRLSTLVARGLFDETLYYRLNVLLLRVGLENAAGIPADGAQPAHIDSSINVTP